MLKTSPFILVLAVSAAQAGDLPDLNITPGSLDPEVNQSDINESICKVTHFTWTEGHMPPHSFLEGILQQKIKEYGLADTNVKHYQADHLIPLSLGGHPTDPKNVWPQLLVTKWSARLKDYLEQTLHDKVCKGEMSLQEAQNLIRTNWIEAYKTYLR